MLENIKLGTLADVLFAIFGVAIPGVTIFLLFPSTLPATNDGLIFLLYAICYSVPFLLIGIFFTFLTMNPASERQVIGAGSLYSIIIFYIFIVLEHADKLLITLYDIYVAAGVILTLEIIVFFIKIVTN